MSQSRREVEQQLKYMRTQSTDIKTVVHYLRLIGAQSYKTAINSRGDDLLAATSELRLIQKLLSVLDNREDPSLITV